MEGRGLSLGNLLHLAEELGGRGLINAAGLCKAADADRFQNTQDTQSIHIAGILGYIKTDLHMGLGGQIVDFIRLHLADDTDQAGGIGEIAIMETKLSHQVIDAGRIGNRCPAGNAMDLVAFFQKEFGKIRAILAGNAGDQCFFHSKKPLSVIFSYYNTSLSICRPLK